MRYRTIALVVFSISASALAEEPSEVRAYLDKDRISLSALRRACNFLTDSHITHYDPGFFSSPKLVPPRKKAVSRFTKRLCDDLEQTWLAQQSLTAQDFKSLRSLALLKESFEWKAMHPKSEVGALGKVAFLWNGFRSDQRLEYDVGKLDGLSSTANASLFWEEAGLKRRPHEEFDQLAKKKKIKFDPENMVVLFQEVSLDGSAPKIKASDLNLDDEWSVKWGDEVHSDVVGSRIFAGLGFDVDHPYFSPRNHLTLVFPDRAAKTPVADMVNAVWGQYKININPWISEWGIVQEAHLAKNPKLAPFLGHSYVRFNECALEARPDRVKRMGSFLPNGFDHPEDTSLRGSLLAHLWINNWDTRESNTLLTTVHKGNYEYVLSGVFSDLGTSMGAKVDFGFKPDFRAGLVNEFDWSPFEKLSPKEVIFSQKMNQFPKPYKEATSSDLKWMATQIAKFDAEDLAKIVSSAGFPNEVKLLMLHKLAARRAEILRAFKVSDPNPITYDPQLSFSDPSGKPLVSNGVLLKEVDRRDHPEGFLNVKGRLRNYGWADL